MFGNSISASDFSGGAIKASYLDTLGNGDYLFDIMTDSGSNVIIVRITGGGEGLSYIKLDYDINYPSVTLLFDGKDGEEYEYSLNSSAYSACTSGMVLSGFSKQRSGNNKITVRSVSDVSDSITLTKSSYNAVNSSYYTSTFKYNGKTYDYVIEDFDELQAMMGYFATVYVPDSNNRSTYMGYAGGKATIKYYVEQNFRDEFAANENEYVNYILLKDSIPYYPSYTNDFVKSTGIETVSYMLSSVMLNSQRSSQEISLPSDNTKLLNTTSTRTETYEGFKINDCTVTQEIRSLYELELLEFGVKPFFKTSTGQAYKVYAKAKEILRSIVDDDMNDYQKAIAIYDYIAMNVTYDSVIAGMAGSSNVGFGQYSCFTSYGALVDGVAVCDGIASALRLMCMIEGIESEEYTGFSVAGGGEGGHAWNKVKLGGNWYGVDATWCTTNINSAGTTTSYAHHKYCFVDEAVLYSSGHRERAEKKDGSLVEYPIEKASYGTFDYFSMVIYGTDNLTRTVKSRSELTKLINYARSIGATVIEIKNASVHGINELIAGSVATGAAPIDSARGIYYVFI